MNNKEYELGSKEFVDGVCFVIEEMCLLGFHFKDSLDSLLVESALANYKSEILENIKENNPDIYEDYLKPQTLENK